MCAESSIALRAAWEKELETTFSILQHTEFYNILCGDLSWKAVRSSLHEKNGSEPGAMTSPS